MNEKEKLKQWIRDYNRQKAELLSLQTPENKIEIENTIKYYDRYLELAERRIIALNREKNKRIRLALQSFLMLMVLVFFGGTLYFLQPELYGRATYTSTLTLDNSTSYFLQIKGEVFTLSFRGNATGNVSVYVEYGNKTYLAFSALNTTFENECGEMCGIEFNDNATLNAMLEPGSVINLEINYRLVKKDEGKKTEKSETASGEENATTQINGTDMTEANVTYQNGSIQEQQPQNLTAENITETPAVAEEEEKEEKTKQKEQAGELAKEENETMYHQDYGNATTGLLPYENETSYETENLPPVGAVPDQLMEENMLLSLNLNDYFTDYENDTLSYSFDATTNFEIDIENSTLYIKTANKTGKMPIVIFVTDGISNTSAMFYVEVLKAYEPTYEGNASQTLNITEDNATKTINETTQIAYEINASVLEQRLKIKIKKAQKINELYTIEAEEENSKIELTIANESLLTHLKINKNIKEAQINGKKARINTPIVAANQLQANATITLEKTGHVNAIVRCNQYDFENDTCNQWETTGIQPIDNGTHIMFNVESFSGYAGAYITIIDLQSYPTVGGNWTVR
ncbi:MAG: hypothetical protein QXK37_02790, partial [Candidatus Woesearchaeota archaeon]